VSALDEVEAFLRQQPTLTAFTVDVRAQRPLSQMIAARSGVQHESPQIILLRRGVPIWNASHYDISTDALADQFRTA
jgi:bacillithiol system protein YtxJ